MSKLFDDVPVTNFFGKAFLQSIRAIVVYNKMTGFYILQHVSQFLVNVLILYTLKTPENFWFSGVFMGYKMVTLGRHGLNPKIILRYIYTFFIKFT